MKRRARVTLAAAGLLSAACEPAPDAAGERATAAKQPIIDGAVVDEDLAVVLVGGLTSVCTGTLVTDRAVLTAAHCVWDHQVEAIEIGGSPVTVASIAIEPSFDPATLGGDLAVLVLTDPPPATPIFLSQSALPPDGSPLRILGFGIFDVTKPLDSVLRSGVTAIQGHDDRTFTVSASPSQPCNGDSGGPALHEGGGDLAVVGVVSGGPPSCSDGARYTRVDAFRESFLEPTLERIGATDVATGAGCSHDANCGTGACFAPPDAPLRRYCTQECASSADCPVEMICSALGASGTCIHAVTPGTTGASCRVDADCDSRVCAATANDAAERCAAGCFPGVMACGEGAACRADARHPGSYACENTPVEELRHDCSIVSAPRRGDSLLVWVLVTAALAAGSARRAWAPAAPPADRSREALRSDEQGASRGATTALSSKLE